MGAEDCSSEVAWVRSPSGPCEQCSRPGVSRLSSAIPLSTLDIGADRLRRTATSRRRTSKRCSEADAIRDGDVAAHDASAATLIGKSRGRCSHAGTPALSPTDSSSVAHPSDRRRALMPTATPSVRQSIACSRSSQIAMVTASQPGSRQLAEELHGSRCPPLPGAARIVEALDSYLTRLDAAVATLEAGAARS